ncbi:YiiX family permuted papain-like enzyme [Sphingobacterium prati]|uniref:YiiX family permuted papain-like enzyme n=1 Tax=Sphingobacterium prati TaxID=2737006 RepID=UPI001557CBA9|nr:YiiX family permuted papain-like enzyme [Sphingobacterium prati]NPE48047.1 YiiX family permuted papain-like enzyme [Sphingobacterium prati]
MKKIALFVLLLVCTMLIGRSYFQINATKAQSGSLGKKVKSSAVLPQLKDGDMIFQSSISPQCKAVQLATGSPYSHCGLIFHENGKPYVLEAIQPVTVTGLADWIARGKNKHYVIKRLKEADKVLSADVLAKMKGIGEEFLGKNYDGTFEWSDNKIYCSELIWKIYQRGAGIEVGKLEKLKDFDLSSAEVKSKLKERYGNRIPLEETVISPGSIFNSELLTTVASN